MRIPFPIRFPPSLKRLKLASSLKDYPIGFVDAQFGPQLAEVVLEGVDCHGLRWPASTQTFVFTQCIDSSASDHQVQLPQRRQG